MTDTTTQDPTDQIDTDAELEPAAESAPAVARDEQRHEALQTRLLIPLLLPILSIIAVALYAVNVSRAFLAGDSTSALIIASIITLLILIGASLISATPGARTSSLAMVVALVMVIVVSAGLLALGPSLDHGGEEGPTQLAQPSGPPVASVEVEALASIRFNADDYPAPAGIVEFAISGAQGHSFQFRTLDYKGFPIGTDGTGMPINGKVELKPGTYNVYCTIDGHAQQGMVAVVTVAEAPPPAS